jgi:hypothetical protein
MPLSNVAARLPDDLESSGVRPVRHLYTWRPQDEGEILMVKRDGRSTRDGNHIVKFEDTKSASVVREARRGPSVFSQLQQQARLPLIPDHYLQRQLADKTWKE